MHLAEAGKIHLDAPVQRYIPWFRVADPEASALITVRHLLNQTSGLTEGAGRAAALAVGMQPLGPAVRARATTRLARSPGAAFEYSNLNYTTLGLVAEMAAGQPFGVGFPAALRIRLTNGSRHHGSHPRWLPTSSDNSRRGRLVYSPAWRAAA